MTDHKYIYLEPECCGEDNPDGRMWCEDPMGNCDLGEPDTKYIRHDLYEQLQTINQQLLESLIDAEEKLSILGFEELEIRQAISKAKQQENAHVTHSK